LKEVRALCGVSDSFLSQPFKLAELMMILQALSCGQVEKGLNSKLSILFTSGPGTGKSLVAGYGQILLPFSGIIQPGLVSPAGLGAVVRVTSGGFTVDPGAVVLASGGSLLFDDLHRVDQRHMNLLQAIFMTVMEKGLVKSTKAAQAEMEAGCGLVMTANRFSMRNGKLLLRHEDYGPNAKGADLVAPFDVLSRTDFVLYMGHGDDAVRSAMNIVCMPPRAEFDPEDDEDLATLPGLSPNQARIRRLQLLIARAKERIPTVDVGPVADEAADTMLVLGVVMREYTAKIQGQSQESYDGDMLIRRMANTVRKILGALGRLHGRAYSTKGDLDRVWDLVTPKLEVVRWLCGEDDRIRPLGTRQEQLKLALWASEQRFQKMMELFGGQMKSAEELAKALGCAEVAVLRDLSRRQIAPEGHLFPIPLQSEWVPDPERDNALDPEVVRPVVVPAAEVAGLPKEKLTYDGPDKLPRPPAEAQTAVEALQVVEDPWMIVEWLLKLVMNLGPPNHVSKETSAGVIATMAEDAMEAHGVDITVSGIHLRKWLLAPEWETRAERAMGLYAEGMGMPPDRWLPDRLKDIQQMVAEHEEKNGPLPAGVSRAIASAYNRLVFYREKWEEILKKEAEQKRRQRRPVA
jgi:hypothetical protein